MGSPGLIKFVTNVMHPIKGVVTFCFALILTVLRDVFRRVLYVSKGMDSGHSSGIVLRDVF